MIINIRGTNGSGKTTLAMRLVTPTTHDADWNNHIITSYDAETKKGTVRKYIHGTFSPATGVLLVGRYGDVNCGGMDRVPTTQLCIDAVQAAAQTRSINGVQVRAVVFEGSLISTVYATWRETAQRLRESTGRRFLWTYLHTPVETCIERVRARTGDKARTKTIEDKHRAVMATRRKALDSGELVLDVLGESVAVDAAAVLARIAEND